MKENNPPPPRKEDLEEVRSVPVVEEELVANAEKYATGSVRVQKHVRKRIRSVEAPLVRETVEVQRVPVNKVVDAAPPVRKKGDTIIVPVVEEELVVSKRLVLKEEIHLVKRRSKERTRQDFTISQESAEVQHLDADGRVTETDRKPVRRIAGH